MTVSDSRLSNSWPLVFVFGLKGGIYFSLDFNGLVHLSQSSVLRAGKGGRRLALNLARCPVT